MKETYGAILKSNRRRSTPFRSIVAPNRLETRNAEFFATLIRSRIRPPLEELRKALRRLTGRNLIFFAPSCRAAIGQILSLLPNAEVVLPAYTCPVVKTAVQIAGKRLLYADIAEHGLNATSAEFADLAKPGRILIPTHVFGFPTDIGAIVDLARSRDCLTVEDAAAALGSRVGGRALGTFGDFGVFSFERSKRYPAFRGAAIIVNNEFLFGPASIESFRLAESRMAFPLREALFALFFNGVTVPWLYGRITLPLILRKYAASDPDLSPDNLEEEKRGPYYAREFHPFQAALVLSSLRRIEWIRSRIREIASIYRMRLSGSAVQVFPSEEGDDAGLLRFPVAFPGRERPDILRNALRHGLFLETNYERPLPEEADWARFPRALWAARNIVLLPLYSRLAASEARRIADVIRKI